MKRLQENLYRVNIVLTLDVGQGGTETLFLNNMIMSQSDYEELAYLYQYVDNASFGKKLYQIFATMDVPCSSGAESQSGPFVFTCNMNRDGLTYKYAQMSEGFFQDWGYVTLDWESIYPEVIQAMPIYNTSPENMRDI